MRLYPEDIAVFFDLIPIGTKVTVVNQPYLFGSRDGTLYLQAYAVMEDDSRDWSNNRKRLLAHLLSPKLLSPKLGKKEVSEQDNGIDWQRVGDLAHSPRAVPVPVSGGQDGIDSVVGNSLLVENTLPEGSNWDGKTGLLVDEKTFNDLVGGQSKAPPVSQSSQPSTH
jgi:L,D-transpeptidase ErfK/SrfK